VSTGICKDKNCTVTPDSGTSLITTPSWALETLSKSLPYEEGCKSNVDYGMLTFVINGVDYDLPSSHYMARYYNVYEQGDSVCMTSITKLDIYQ
jgi:hypothetical protein